MLVKNRTETVISEGLVINKDQPRYGYFIDDNGERQFGVVGTIDTYAEILRHKDETDYTLLKNYLYNNPSSKEFGLFGVRPQDINDVNDMNNLVLSLNQMYSLLPNEIKSKYKNFYEVINGFNEQDLQIFENSFNSVSNSDEVSKNE